MNISKVKNMYLFLAIILFASSLNTQFLYAETLPTNDYVPILFSGSNLRDCSEVKHINTQECESKKYFVRYMTTKLVSIRRGYIFGSSIADNIGTGFEMKPAELKLTHEAGETMLTAVEHFSQYESPTFQACLLAICGELIATPIGASINLPSRWHELSSLFSCFVENKQDTGSFYDAKRGVYVGCFSESTSVEAIDIGIAISPSGSKF